MLTNTRMNITEVNAFMKASLITQQRSGNLDTDISKLERYNGVDVDNLYSSKRKGKRAFKLDRKQAQRKLQSYLTKYVTKNDTTMNRLPWHCSRDVSALFTSQRFGEDEYIELIEHVKNHPDQYKVFQKESVTIYIPKYPIILSDHTDLISINNQLIAHVRKKNMP